MDFNLFLMLDNPFVVSRKPKETLLTNAASGYREGSRQMPDNHTGSKFRNGYDLALRPELDSQRLEPRILLSADVNLVRVLDINSQGGGKLKVDYQLPEGNSKINGLHFDFYRSADANFDSSDKRIASINSPGLDSTSNQSLTVDAGQAMRPDPSRPFVVVVARASGVVAETNLTDNSASFRKYTIAVVCHGGIQGSHYNIPSWEAKLGHKLQSYGYDRVIAFNWANKSWTSGAAARQAPRMARRIVSEAAGFPAGSTIDLDFIAHSEGTVVVTQAQKFLDKVAPERFSTGYKRMSLLDPHAANPSAPNNGESTAGGLKGWLTKRLISWYKGNARDPLVQIPDSVNEADVYYQRTPVSINPVNGGLYNLLGQVPVIGSARYIQLNSPGISHSGGGGVYTWFYFNALPAFATGDQPKNPSVLKADSVSIHSGGWNENKLYTADTSPIWSGMTSPGATVRLYATPVQRKADDSRPMAET
ncbi:MAG: LEPR-XLL domain-containing protein, partial [bacterium]